MGYTEQRVTHAAAPPADGADLGQNTDDKVLVIHPGGLGDICLSESTFLSLRHHFGDRLEAVGNKRVLDEFSEYFTRVDSIDARAWAFLFSGTHEERPWETIVLIGKDRSTSFRQRLRLLTDNLIFVEMYPDEERICVEEFQLRQVRQSGIEPLLKALPVTTGSRIILYPEKPYRKEKWPVEDFLQVREELKRRGLTAILMRPSNVTLPGSDLDSPELLGDVAAFFSEGGFFCSNDSGMAHFAARCGLRALTFFSGTDPLVWRPKNGLVLSYDKEPPTVDEVAAFITAAVSGRASRYGPAVQSI